MKKNSKVLNRTAGQQIFPQQINFGCVIYFPDSLELILENHSCILPPIPAKVLNFLIHCDGIPASRQDIVKAVWPRPELVTKENFYQTIKRLRQFLGDCNKPRNYIVNSRTNHYVLKPEVTVTSLTNLELREK